MTSNTATGPASSRRVLLIVNPRSAEAHAALSSVVDALVLAGAQVAITDEDRDAIAASGGPALDPTTVTVGSDEHAADAKALASARDAYARAQN